MKLFQEEDDLKESINKLSIADLNDTFNKLPNEQRIFILLSWFGMQPLFNQMIDNQKGKEHFKEILLKGGLKTK
jgi:hypothetical protein